MDEHSGWLAALQAACAHEFAPHWLRKPRRLHGGPWPLQLEVGVNGAGLAGVYCLQEGGDVPSYWCEKVPDACLELSTSLGLWLLLSKPIPDADDRAQKTRCLYNLGSLSGRQLLYAGNAAQDLMQMDWFPVLGASPAPRIFPRSASKTALTLDTVQLGSGRGQRLSAETASATLAFLLDLRSARLRSCIHSRALCNLTCDTAPQIALWLLSHAGDAQRLACVCKSFRGLVQLYRNQWPDDFLRLFQLHGSHGWPVAKPNQVLQVLSRSSWQNMLHLTDLPAFRDNAWPVHVTSVALKMPAKTQPDNYLDFSTLRELRGPFAAFAWKLLHDIPLPWAKMLASRPMVREGMTSSRASPSDSETKTLTADLLYENCLQGHQHLAGQTGLLVTSGGFVSRNGCFIRRRVGAALRDLARTVPSLCLTGWSQGWSSSFRDGGQLCFFCERDASEERCRQCKDTRSWSTLSASFSMSFSLEVNGDPTQVEFAIEARALPFMSISSDVRIYDKLEDVFGKLDEVEQFEDDMDENKSDEDEDTAESAEQDNGTETAREGAEEAKDDTDGTTELPSSQDSMSSMG